ncbi:MAG TPA: endonuclease III [Enhygromyxa sp.]|nr:endonuclease III [Enhygromyxa sp.]
MSPTQDPAALLAEVDDRLTVALPEPSCELDHDDAWQLLVVTILSAQAKDSVINEIRPALFERWPTPADLAAAPQEEVEEVVKRSGYFRNKAKAIRECAQAIVDRHGGEVPRSHEQLIGLPGASHKTANLVLGIAFGVASGIVVDTHVARVSERLGLVKPNAKPEAIEKRLCELSPSERWIGISHRLILHGRHVCRASDPDCDRCAINELCKSRRTPPNDDWRTRAEAEARLFVVRGDRARAGWAHAQMEIGRASAPIDHEPPPEPAGFRSRVVEDEEDF